MLKVILKDRKIALAYKQERKAYQVGEILYYYFWDTCLKSIEPVEPIEIIKPVDPMEPLEPSDLVKLVEFGEL